MDKPTGICDWRLFGTARSTFAFWRVGGGLLRGEEIEICRKGRNRLRPKNAEVIASEIPKTGSARLPFCESAGKSRAIWARAHCGRNETLHVAGAKAGVRDSICGMDARQSSAATRVSGIARG